MNGGQQPDVNAQLLALAQSTFARGMTYRPKPPPPPKTRGWFMVEAGAAIRGSVRRQIEKEAWARGLEIKTDESKGFFESAYRFTVTGDDKKVRAFVADAGAWMQKFR